MHRKTVFITGVSGMLGSSLVPKLQQEFTIAHAMTGTDLSDHKTCHKLLDAHRPVAIINLAAMTDVDQCEQYPEKAFFINAKLVQNLSDWCAVHSCRLIQISTDMVYNTPGFNREDNTTILNEYAKSKFKGEVFAQSADALVLRTNFFGHSLAPHRKSFSDWLLENMRSQSPLRLTQDVDFSPLNITTLCDEIVRTLKSDIRGIFNLGAKTKLSKKDFAYALAELYGFNIQSHSTTVNLKDLNLKAPRPNHMAMDVSKYEAAFATQLPTLAEEIQKLKLQMSNS